MIELEQTADGSYTLFVPELNEHYHSVKGALTESERHCPKFCVNGNRIQLQVCPYIWILFSKISIN